MSILHCSWDIARYWSKITNLPTYICGPRWGWPLFNFAKIFGIRKLVKVPGLSYGTVCVILGVADLLEHLLIFYPCGFSFVFDAESLRSLNGSQPNLDTYSLMTAIWKMWSQLPRVFTPTGWRAKNCFVDADFKRCPNISLQRDMVGCVAQW